MGGVWDDSAVGMYGDQSSYGGFDEATGAGYSAARNSQSVLGSLSDRASPQRMSRYGQSTQDGYSSSKYDYGMRDQYSMWDYSKPRVESIRDAGVKDRPSSVLGSIASLSQKRMKEIERYVYEEDGLSRPNPNTFLKQNGYRGVDYEGYSRQNYAEDDQYSYNAESENIDQYDLDYDSYQSGVQRRYGNDDSSYLPQRVNAANPYSSVLYQPRRMDQFGSDYDNYESDDQYAPRGRGWNAFDKSTRNTFGRVRKRFSDDEDDEYFDSVNGRRRPPYSQRRPRVDYYNDSGWGSRQFGADSRNIDYQSMNRPFDRQSRENSGYNTQIRLPRTMGEFDGHVQSKWGHIGQSLIDYQVKPPRRGRRPVNGIIDSADYDQNFGPIYDDHPYFEPY